MKLSLQYYAMVPLLRKGLINTEQIFQYAVQDGYEAIEYLLFDPTMEVEGIRSLLDKYNLAVSCVDCFFDFANSDEEIFKKQVEMAYMAVDKAKILGSKYLMVVPAYEESVNDKEEARNNIIRGLKILVEYAQDRKIGITIEDYPNLRVPLCSISDIKRVLNEVPGLFLTFDTGNFMIAEDNSTDALKELFGYVKNVHAKDWKIAEEGTCIKTVSGRKVTSSIHGSGLINLQKIFHELKENGYDGYVSVEYEGDMKDLEPIKECTRNLKSMIEHT